MESRVDIKLVTDDEQTILVVTRASLERDQAIFRMIRPYPKTDDTTKFSARMVKDHDRTVIVLTGDAQQQKDMASKIAGIYLGFVEPPPAPPIYQHNSPPPGGAAFGDDEDDETPVETAAEGKIPCVTCLAPPAEEADTVPTAAEVSNMQDYAKLDKQGSVISGGIYRGMTPIAALAKDRDKALACLFSYCRNLPSGPEKTNITRYCKQFMRELSFIKNEYDTREKKIDFLRSASTMTKISLFYNGYSDFASFTKNAQDDEIKHTFDAVVRALEERGILNASAIR